MSKGVGPQRAVLFAQRLALLGLATAIGSFGTCLAQWGQPVRAWHKLLPWLVLAGVLMFIVGLAVRIATLFRREK
jgi:hypothetical protein